MKKQLLTTVLTFGLIACVQAIPITGTIRMAGDVTLDTQSLLTANNATALSSVQVSGAPTGSWAGTAGTPVTWKPFGWNPSTAPVNDLWSFNFGGFVYTFDLASITSVNRTTVAGSDFLTITGLGSVDITGAGSPYDTTPANWSFTVTDTSGGTAGSFVFGFADSNTAIPDGGMTLVLLGAALTGLGFIRRKLSA